VKRPQVRQGQRIWNTLADIKSWAMACCASRSIWNWFNELTEIHTIWTIMQMGNKNCKIEPPKHEYNQCQYGEITHIPSWLPALTSNPNSSTIHLTTSSLPRRAAAWNGPTAARHTSASHALPFASLPLASSTIQHRKIRRWDTSTALHYMAKGALAGAGPHSPKTLTNAGPHWRKSGGPRPCEARRLRDGADGEPAHLWGGEGRPRRRRRRRPSAASPCLEARRTEARIEDTSRRWVRPWSSSSPWPPASRRRALAPCRRLVPPSVEGWGFWKQRKRRRKLLVGRKE
jgi:hypothetical protein